MNKNLKNQTEKKVNYQKPSKNKKQKQNLWFNMWNRCYNRDYYGKSYEDCTICDEWLEDRQKFYDWVDQNYYVIDGERSVELDKDILVPGNKIYSPDTCVFSPRRINGLFIHVHGVSDNGLPTGVVWDKQYQKYVVHVSHTDENGDCRLVKIGRYKTVKEAYEAYKTHKKAEIIYVADLYKGRIPDKLYDAMVNFQFDEFL